MRSFCLLCAVLAGCSSSAPPSFAPVAVKGRVVQNGKPPARAPNDRLVITFFAEQGVMPPGMMFAADAGPDGSFEIKPANSDGIPPGKYRIAVALMDGKGKDKLQGAFSPATTPFVQDISSDLDDLVLDIRRR